MNSKLEVPWLCWNCPVLTSGRTAFCARAVSLRILAKLSGVKWSPSVHLSRLLNSSHIFDWSDGNRLVGSSCGRTRVYYQDCEWKCGLIVLKPISALAAVSQALDASQILVSWRYLHRHHLCMSQACLKRPNKVLAIKMLFNKVLRHGLYEILNLATRV